MTEGRCTGCCQGTFYGIFISTVMKDLDCATNGRFIFLLLSRLFVDGNASVMLQWVLVQKPHPNITAIQSVKENSACLR